MNYWLIKSEPFKYSWDHFVEEGQSMWDGVRNYQARNNMMAMKTGDQALFYHSNEGKEVVGIAKVSKEHYPDPTTDDPRWVVVNFVPVAKLPKAISLKQIKQDPTLQDMALVKHSRLSVAPLKAEEFDHIVALAYET
ncbi:putative RNA-binding protein with PUA-like domain [Dyadobacter jejuensis]|uniref:Putative RNA-binding protein with PUA-like domain n=1 Tax=Dyadobacter jejuensis TaxID=1082580 RepID=A0A316ANC7_9BACT|nr:EVE domain-containing protein [Dyadobacter jejuensis]PWJ59042.1 putative RNA-binding protein with PUA-like domain [Dyadobacter jejuensis]